MIKQEAQGKAAQYYMAFVPRQILLFDEDMNDHSFQLNSNHIVSV